MKIKLLKHKKDLIQGFINWMIKVGLDNISIKYRKPDHSFFKMFPQPSFDIYDN